MEKILFFLLINGKCYATQLHQRFDSPLTPLQHALNKLEKCGVLLSHTEGKTRFFELNPGYPLIHELEALLKRAYALLPLHLQKKFYSPTLHHKTSIPPKPLIADSQAAKDTLLLFWEKLRNIQSMCFSAKSKSLTTSGRNGLGKGTVEVKIIDQDILVFYERGTWISIDNNQMDFSNVFRWHLRPKQGVIALEHLRFGADYPVFLFNLIPINVNTLESMDSHICKEDTYFGQVRCDNHFIQFNWRILGPKKNEEIDYLYT